MATQEVKYTSGLTLAKQIVVDATTESDGELLLDYNVNYDLTACIQIQDGSGVNVDLADAVITFPAEGQVKIENGGATFALTEDYVVNVLAFRRR